MANLSLGGWPLGDSAKNASDTMSDEHDLEILRHALESGMTHFDTAELYASGHSEELLGQAIKDYDRSTLFIASKVLGGSGASRFRQACEDSLARVGTDYFDLYYIHWREDGDDLAAQMRAMEELYEAGLIKNIGVSNFNTESLKEAQSVCKYPIVANQVHYSLVLRGPERDGLVEYCQNNDVMLVAYRPVELGKIANNPSKFASIIKKYRKTSAQVGINWLISQPNVVTIFGCLRKEFIDENLGAEGWTMDSDDIEFLRANYSGQKDISDSVPLG